MAAPHKKPQAIRIIEGGGDSRGVAWRKPNEAQPQRRLSDTEIRAPKTMTKRGKLEWEQMIQPLHEIGLLSPGDLPLFEKYCELLAAWRELNEFVAKNGVAYDEPLFDRNGTLRGHKHRAYPEADRWLTLSSKLLSYEVQLGMTPSARNNVNSLNPEGVQKPHNPFDYDS